MSGTLINNKQVSFHFDDTQADPGNGGAVTKDWLMFEPLVKGNPYSSTFGLKQSSVRFGSGNANDTIDDIFMLGWNISSGGGLESSNVVGYTNVAAFPGTGDYNTIYRDNSNSNESTRYYNWTGSAYVVGTKRGKTGIGFSMEARYNFDDNGNMKTESHQFYIDAAGIQHRISSFEINTSINDIGHYRTVSGESLRVPGGVGFADPDITYWSVTPGQAGVSDVTGAVGTTILSQYQIDYGGTANVSTILGYNMDWLILQGYNDISFGNATIHNAVIATNTVSFSGAVALPDGISVSSLTLYDVPTNEYAYFSLETASNKMHLYGVASSIENFAFHNFLDVNFGGANLSNCNLTGTWAGGNVSGLSNFNGGINTVSLAFIDGGDYSYFAPSASSDWVTYYATNFPKFRWNGLTNVNYENLQNMALGTSSNTASAMLELHDVTRGFLPNQGTTTEKNAISSPAEGLIFYDTTLHKLYVYDGSAWQACW